MIKINYLSFLCLFLYTVFSSFAHSPQSVGVFSQPFAGGITPVSLFGLPHSHLFMELWTTDSALQLHFRNQDVLVTNLISDSKQKDNIDAAPCIIGNSCDDGNPNTVNDRIKADCNCEGEPIALFCEDLSISYQLSDGLRETAGLAITVKEGDSL